MTALTLPDVADRELGKELAPLPARAPRVRRNVRPVIESLAVTVILPVVGLLLHPRDPLFLEGAFPWALVPVLGVALRYGVVAGLGSALLLTLGAVAAERSGIDPGGVPDLPERAVGLGLVALVAGELAERLRRLAARSTVEADTLRRRLRAFGREHQLLAASHDKLEQRLAGRAHGLREALFQLRARIGGEPDPQAALRAAGEEILQLFADHGFVEGACLYALGDDGEPLPEPVAHLGASPRCQLDGALAHAALRERRVATVPADATPGVAGGPLAAIPFVDAGGTPRALALVQQMPFIAFQHETLALLAVLAGRVADPLAAGGGRGPGEFLAELERAAADADRHGIPSAAVGLRAPRGLGPLLVELVLAERREIDPLLVTEEPGGATLVRLILPLATLRGAEAFHDRLERRARDRAGRGLGELGLVGRALEVDGRIPAAELLERLARKEAA